MGERCHLFPLPPLGKDATSSPLPPLGGDAVGRGGSDLRSLPLIAVPDPPLSLRDISPRKGESESRSAGESNNELPALPLSSGGDATYSLSPCGVRCHLFPSPPLWGEMPQAEGGLTCVHFPSWPCQTPLCHFVTSPPGRGRANLAPRGNRTVSCRRFLSPLEEMPLTPSPPVGGDATYSLSPCGGRCHLFPSPPCGGRCRRQRGVRPAFTSPHGRARPPLSLRNISPEVGERGRSE